MGGEEGIKMWLAELKMMFPLIKESYDVAPMPDGWTHVDPVIGLRSMVGDETKIIKVEI
jgi:hypothetical protein